MDDLTAALAEILKREGLTLAVAESCTGGGLAHRLTGIAGSSAWFDRGFVTYSNAAKTAMLGVPAAVIETDGAVSDRVARAMAIGARDRSGVLLAAAITGIAGPGGGRPDKPVGTVFIAVAIPGAVTCTCHHFAGERRQVRDQAIDGALKALIEHAKMIKKT